MAKRVKQVKQPKVSREYGEKLKVDGKVASCIECGSTHIVKKGYTPSRQGLKMRLWCWDCGRSFYPEAIKAKGKD